MSLQSGRIVGLFAALDVEAGFVTSPQGALTVGLDGVAGDRHAGRTRAAGPREPWMPKGLTIRNDRQLSALAAEELREIAASLGVASAAPELVGANILVEGVAGFSRLAPGSHLAIGGDWAGKGKFDGEVILRAEAYNHPCRGPGRKLAAAHGDPELEFAFVKAARSLRGLVLSVAAPGVMRVGDAVVIMPPSLAP